AEATDVEFEKFWCRKVKVFAKAGDGEFGVDASTRLSSARASSSRPRCANAATLTRIAETRRGWSCNARSAHSIACSKRRAARCATAILRAQRKVYGSNGLKRRARSMASIAASGWLRTA